VHHHERSDTRHGGEMHLARKVEAAEEIGQRSSCTGFHSASPDSTTRMPSRITAQYSSFCTALYTPADAAGESAWPGIAHHITRAAAAGGGGSGRWLRIEQVEQAIGHQQPHCAKCQAIEPPSQPPRVIQGRT
jgi:hypothetical protein